MLGPASYLLLSPVHKMYTLLFKPSLWLQYMLGSVWSQTGARYPREWECHGTCSCRVLSSVVLVISCACDLSCLKFIINAQEGNRDFPPQPATDSCSEPHHNPNLAYFCRHGLTPADLASFNLLSPPKPRLQAILPDFPSCGKVIEYMQLAVRLIGGQPASTVVEHGTGGHN